MEFQQDYLLLIAGSATILVFQVNRANKAAGLIRTHTSEILKLGSQSEDYAADRIASLRTQITYFKRRYELIFVAAISSLIGIAFLVGSVIFPESLKAFSPAVWSFCYILGLILTLIEYAQGWITLDEEIRTTERIIRSRETNAHTPDVYKEISSQVSAEIVKEIRGLLEESGESSLLSLVAPQSSPSLSAPQDPLARESPSLFSEQHRSSAHPEIDPLSQPGLPALLSEIQAIQAEVPAEEWDKIPHDGSINHDHYLYGEPKVEP